MLKKEENHSEGALQRAPPVQLEHLKKQKDCAVLPMAGGRSRSFFSRLTSYSKFRGLNLCCVRWDSFCLAFASSCCYCVPWGPVCLPVLGLQVLSKGSGSFTRIRGKPGRITPRPAVVFILWWCMVDGGAVPVRSQPGQTRKPLGPGGPPGQ